MKRELNIIVYLNSDKYCKSIVIYGYKDVYGNGDHILNLLKKRGWFYGN